VHRAGVANVENERVWRPRDHMRPASVSKAFNGAVALSLVQRGQLELDDTIGEILPALPPAWAPVTLGQLPQHTSGLPNYTTSPGFQAALGPNLRRRFTPIELIGFVADDPLQFAPGTSYAYSNTDNIVAALMAEDVAGRSYEGLLRSQVYNRRRRQTVRAGDPTRPAPLAARRVGPGGSWRQLGRDGALPLPPALRHGLRPHRQLLRLHAVHRCERRRAPGGDRVGQHAAEPGGGPARRVPSPAQGVRARRLAALARR
jgi:D-alanyl-D-alanine carboxypeptidase